MKKSFTSACSRKTAFPEAGAEQKIRAKRRPTLVVMLKEPRAGRVKTRLGRDIGMTAASWWFRHQTKTLLSRLQDRRWNLILAISPDTHLRTSSFRAEYARIPQGQGDLGARMGRIFRSLPPGPVAIIGGDIPGITCANIKRAFQALGAHDAVFGPAPDGGYWLIGLRRTRIPSNLFNDVRWSGEHALSDTISSLDGQSVALIDTLADVDTGRDLARWP